MSVKNRIFYYDFLRAFAIIAVVLCHVDGIFHLSHSPFKAIIPCVFTNIGLMGVPIFFMLSGALLLNKKYDLGDFFKRRFGRIIYPFIFWVIVRELIGIFLFHWNGEKVFNVFVGINSSTWYVWTLIGIYLFIPVINSYLKEYELKGFELFLGIWFATIILNTFGLYPFATLELSYFAGYLGFVVLGYYLDKKQFRFSDRSMFYLGTIILIVSVTLHMILSYWHIPVFPDKYLNITITFQAIGMFLFVKYLDAISLNNIYTKIKSNIVGKAIVSLSVCSYGIYLVHSIVTHYLKQLDITSIKLLPLLLIATVVFCWIVVYMFSKIPYLKKVSGV